MQLHLECSLQVLSADNDILTCDVEVCLCWLLPERENEQFSVCIFCRMSGQPSLPETLTL